MWDKRAAALGNHDGDNVNVMLDQGFGDTKTIELRLDGVYAPELTQTGGEATRDFVTAWITERTPSGSAKWPFIVTTRMNRTITKEVRTFTRYVGTLMYNQESLNAAVNEFVAVNGYPRGMGT